MGYQISERERLLMQAKKKRAEAQAIRDMTRLLSVHLDKAMFERHAEWLEREARCLEEKAAGERPDFPALEPD
jgi:hypothetical protein